MGTTARLDRSVLTLLGLMLTAIGVLALLVGFGVFGSRLRHKPILDNYLSAFVGRNGPWLWPVIAVVVVLLALLALRWLIAQLTPTATGDLQLERPSRDGYTELAGSALTSAVTSEIQSYRGVAGARVRLVGDTTDPELRLRVQLDSTADVAALRRRIETDAINHARQALDQPQLPVRLDLILTEKKAARVA